MNLFKEDDVIVHLESGNTYQVMGPIKVKLDDVWHDCVRYAATDGTGAEYARRYEDMLGKFAHAEE